MKGNPRVPSRPPPTLNFMSINVGTGGATQDIALSRAYELGVDVLLIQEPCGKSAQRLQRHIRGTLAIYHVVGSISDQGL